MHRESGFNPNGKKADDKPTDHKHCFVENVKGNGGDKMKSVVFSLAGHFLSVTLALFYLRNYILDIPTL